MLPEAVEACFRPSPQSASVVVCSGNIAGTDSAGMTVASCDDIGQGDDLDVGRRSGLNRPHHAKEESQVGHSQRFTAERTARKRSAAQAHSN